MVEGGVVGCEEARPVPHRTSPPRRYGIDRRPTGTALRVGLGAPQNRLGGGVAESRGEGRKMERRALHSKNEQRTHHAVTISPSATKFWSSAQWKNALRSKARHPASRSLDRPLPGGASFSSSVCCRYRALLDHPKTQRSTANNINHSFLEHASHIKQVHRSQLHQGA